ncbi:MAG: hypothetical protein AAGB32_01845 [Pseudomonadota bacterium]
MSNIIGVGRFQQPAKDSPYIDALKKKFLFGAKTNLPDQFFFSQFLEKIPPAADISVFRAHAEGGDTVTIHYKSDGERRTDTLTNPSDMELRSALINAGVREMSIGAF